MGIPKVMKRIRKHIAVILALVMVLTGHSMAIARGMPAATGFMELCTGTGPVMVPMDAQGNPTGPAHICPDFTLSLMDAVAVPQGILMQLSGSVHIIWDAEVALFIGVQAIAPSARDPPVNL